MVRVMECWSRDGVWELGFGDLVGDEEVGNFGQCVSEAALFQPGPGTLADAVIGGIFVKK